MPMNTTWLATIPEEHRQFFEGLQMQIASWQYDRAAALTELEIPHSITQTGLVDPNSWAWKNTQLIAYARNFREQLQTFELQTAEPYAYLDEVLTELDAGP